MTVETKQQKVNSMNSETSKEEPNKLTGKQLQDSKIENLEATVKILNGRLSAQATAQKKTDKLLATTDYNRAINNNKKIAASINKVLQNQMTKITVITELRFMTDCDHSIMTASIRMLDDVEMDYLFNSSRTMDKWLAIVNEYSKNL